MACILSLPSTITRINLRFVRPVWEWRTGLSIPQVWDLPLIRSSADKTIAIAGNRISIP